jgi:pyruvate kinase
VLESLLRSGLDVARINAAHGTVEEHHERISGVRAIADSLSRPVAVLLDLPGPKLRALLEEPLPLVEGQDVTLAARPGAAAQIGITEPDALVEIRPNQRVLLDDGRLQLRVLRRQGEVIVLRVVAGGTLLPNKGINLPDTTLSLPSATARDREALALAARGGVAGWVFRLSGAPTPPRRCAPWPGRPA